LIVGQLDFNDYEYGLVRVDIGGTHTHTQYFYDQHIFAGGKFVMIEEGFELGCAYFQFAATEMLATVFTASIAGPVWSLSLVATMAGVGLALLVLSCLFI
jgi:hypothetical protein